MRTALDSALTSPYGLAVAVTAETGRYAGVVSADDILAKVKDVRASIAESISIREAEAAHAYEPVAESEQEYETWANRRTRTRQRMNPSRRNERTVRPSSRRKPESGQARPGQQAYAPALGRGGGQRGR